MLTALRDGGATESDYLPGDISDVLTIERLFAEVKQRVGHLNVLVHNAGVTIDKPVNAVTEEMWDAVMNPNLKAAFFLAKHSLNLFPRQEGGVIIYVGSIVGEHGNTGQELYAASKSGFRGLGNSFVKDLGRRNIRVNLVNPGVIETDFINNMNPDVRDLIIASTPMKRLGRPEDVAYAIACLASPYASFITGAVLTVDGGFDGSMGGVEGAIRAGYKKPQP